MRGDFHVGDWLVQPALCRLSRDGRTVRVRARVMDLLAYLAEHPGEVLAKDTLLEDVWGTQAISESALTRTVTELRQALEDDADHPQLLETIPKRGYRLIVPVTPATSLVTSPNPEPVRRRAVSRRAAVSMTVVAAALLVAVAGWLWRGTVSRASPAGLSFAAREWVLIVPFENRTGDPVFDDVLEQALEREMIGSGFVNVVPRPRVEDALALMKKPTDLRLDAALARELALRDGGIRAMLTGRISRIGGGFSLTTEIVNPLDGTVRANITDDVPSQEELLHRVRGQALQVRRTLGEALPSIERSRTTLQKVTTPSLPALQLYSRAATLLEGEFWRSRPEAINHSGTAEALLRRATEIDPSFASAWFLLAHAICNQNRPRAEYMPFAERAMALSGNVTPTERYMIEGFTHRRRIEDTLPGRGELEPSARAYEALLQLAPDHYWALLEVVPVYRELGRVHDADRVTLQAAAARPHSVRFGVDSAKIHLRRGDMASARAVVERVLLLATSEPESAAGVAPDSLGWLRLWKAHEAWLNGDVTSALEAVRAADQQGAGTTRLWQLANVYQGLGRFGDAVRVAERMEAPERNFLVALILARRERWADLRRLLKPESNDFQVLQHRLGMLVWAGWLHRAEWVVAERQRRKTPVVWHMRADQEGQLRVAQKRYADGMAQLLSLSAIKIGPRLRVEESIAVARRALGDRDGAIRDLERIGDARADAVAYDGWFVYDWLRCRMLLAELYDEAGRDAQAEQLRREIENLLGVADSDHPLRIRLATLTKLRLKPT